VGNVEGQAGNVEALVHKDDRAVRKVEGPGRKAVVLPVEDTPAACRTEVQAVRTVEAPVGRIAEGPAEEQYAAAVDSQCSDLEPQCRIPRAVQAQSRAAGRSFVAETRAGRGAPPEKPKDGRDGRDATGGCQMERYSMALLGAFVPGFGCSAGPLVAYDRAICVRAVRDSADLAEFLILEYTYVVTCSNSPATELGVIQRHNCGGCIAADFNYTAAIMWRTVIRSCPVYLAISVYLPDECCHFGSAGLGRQ
jgi:hypothetical protein